MGAKQDLTNGDRLGLQNHKGEAVLRAHQPKGPRVEKDRGRSLQGQDMPAQNRGQTLRRFEQNRAEVRVGDRARRAQSHVLRTRLRV